jgi:hypothetical protein
MAEIIARLALNNNHSLYFRPRFEHHFQQYFSYIVAVSFIGGENWRNPQTCCKSLANFIP